MMTMMNFLEVHTAPEYPYGIYRCMPERKEGRKKTSLPVPLHARPRAFGAVQWSLRGRDGYVLILPLLLLLQCRLRAKRDKKQPTTQKYPSTVDG